MLHSPAVHTARDRVALGHARSQTPQWSALDVRSTHRLPQRSGVGARHVSTQPRPAPTMPQSGVGSSQPAPHAPQSSEVPRLVSQPLVALPSQSPRSGPHASAHAPRTHA